MDEGRAVPLTSLFLQFDSAGMEGYLGLPLAVRFSVGACSCWRGVFAHLERICYNDDDCC